MIAAVEVMGVVLLIAGPVEGAGGCKDAVAL